MTGAIKTARKGRTCRADRNEARRAPDILAVGRRRAGAEAAAQRIAGRLVHRHQLQLVRRIDDRRPFGSQHRTRAGAAVEGAVGADRHPVVAAGTTRAREIETHIITRYQHLRRAQPLRIRGGAVEALADAVQAGINRAVKIGAVDATVVMLAHDGAHAGAAARHLARGVHIRDGAAHVVADHAACQPGGLHIACHIAIAQGSA